MKDLPVYWSMIDSLSIVIKTNSKDGTLMGSIQLEERRLLNSSSLFGNIHDWTFPTVYC